MENFQSLGLPEPLLHSLKVMQFEKPTPIQAQTIPFALEGNDILGSAQTGTGKTAAYGIPLVSFLLTNPDSNAIVLTPTRELALQVLKALREMIGRESYLRATLLIGGEPIDRQLRQLERKPRVIVGTPGRINDHLSRGSLKLNTTRFVVFDETDRMLDMGFSIQLKEIAQYLPAKRQTLMFSATMMPESLKIAQSYLNNAKEVAIGLTNEPTKNVEQEIIRTKDFEKYERLLNRLDKINTSCIIFVKTKIGADKLARKLRDNDRRADAIHGDLRQRKRERVIKTFRERKNRILVATDIAARGIDVPHLEYVINYDLPQCPEDYIHRIGRTGRAGAQGTAISFVGSQDNIKWKRIYRLMNPNEKFEDTDSDNDRRRSRSRHPRRRNESSRRFSRDKKFSEKKDYKRSGKKFSDDKKDSKRPGKKYSDDKKKRFKKSKKSSEKSFSKDSNNKKSRDMKPRRKLFKPARKNNNE